MGQITSKQPEVLIPDDWDEVVGSAPSLNGFLHSSLWAKINQAVHDVEPLFIIDDAGSFALMIGVLCKKYSSCIPFIKRRKVMAESSNAPVVNDAKSLKKAVMAVEAVLRGRGYVQVRIRESDGLLQDIEGEEAVYRELGYKKEPWCSAVLDLSIGEEELFGTFKHAVRKAIRKCEKEGVEISFLSGAEEIRKNFYDPYLSETGRKGMSDDQWQSYIQADQYDCYSYVVAKKDGNLLGLLGSYAFNGVATEATSCITQKGWDSKLPVQDLIHWKMFCHHIKRGDKWFDLAGYSPNPQTPKEKGIKVFKEKWGGNEVRSGFYTKTL